MRVNRKSGRLRVAKKKDAFNPMEGMGNLADVMLVFACGLIVALIFFWNVDVTTSDNSMVDPDQKKYEIEGIEENSTQTIDGEAGMEEMGTVYKDPETGKYYVVEGDSK